MKTAYQWLRKAYSGFLWPYLAFAGGVFYVQADKSPTWWHHVRWFIFAAAIVAVNVAQAKIRKVQR